MRAERLLLRDWRESDLDTWVAMNADPEVREHFPNLATRAESLASAELFQSRIAANGWGLWAVEVIATGEFIGFIGLAELHELMPISGIEIGWRLTRSSWGHDYAT